MDGVARLVSFTHGQNNSVSVTIPHFWFTLGTYPLALSPLSLIFFVLAALDPNYNILLDNTPCHSAHSLLLLEVILPIAVVIVAVLAVVFALWVRPRLHVWYTTRHGRREVHKKEEKEGVELNSVHERTGMRL